MSLILREQKGEPLTHKESDDNLSYLDLVTQGGTIKGDLSISGYGQNLSIGATVNYIHGPDVADTEWDFISDNVHLTRGFTGSVYNILGNPIKWNRDGWSDLTDLSDRIFYDNLTEIQSNIDNWLVGSELILLDVTDNKYYKIEFTYWQAGGEEGNGGEFTYNRNLVTPRIYQKLQTEEISAIKITADELTVTDLSVDNVITSSDTWPISISGNAATVTDGVYTTGSYSDPTWLNISKSKVGLGSVEDTKLSTWPGSTSITTLGTISTGTVPWARLSNVPSSFTPSLHTHGNITNDGKIGATSGLMITTTTGGALTTLAAGTTGQFLAHDGTWSTPPNTDTTYSGGTGLNISGTKFSVIYGTTAGSAAQGNDSRLSDARTPLSHTHGNITNDGKIGTTAGLMITTTTGGALTTIPAGTTSQYLRGDGTWDTPQGTVTSVSGSGSYGGLTLTGTVTSSGNLTLGGTPTGTWPISVTGNAGTVTDGVYTTSSYTDPAWLTINKSKVGLPNVENTKLSTWAGSTNITTLGTIATGTIPWGIISNVPSSFTPSSHIHGNITNDGKIGTTANLIVKTTTGGALATLAAGTTSEYLRGDGTWATTPDTTYSGGIGLNLSGTKFSVIYGNTAGSAAQGNDSRLSDAREPLSHEHGNITNDGTIGTTAGLMIKTTTGGALATMSAGTTSEYLRGDGAWSTPPQGTVTSVSTAVPISGGPITGSGTISLADNYGDLKNPYASKTAKYFLAAPNGATGLPTFRAILASDIPTLNQSTTGSAGSVANTLTRGSYLTGNNFNGSFATTWAVDATTTATANKIVARDASGNIQVVGIKTPTGTSAGFLKADGSIDTTSYATPPVSITYTALKALVDLPGLIVGQRYIINDYQTVHEIPNSGLWDEVNGEFLPNAINTGPVEPLLVTALSVNKLSNECYSLTFPEDIIYYDIESNQEMVPGCTKGYIYRRIDTKTGNDIGLDYRNVKFRRWQINVTNEHVTGDASFSKGAVVKKTGTVTIYIKLTSDTGAFTDTSKWKRFEWNNLQYISPVLYSGTYAWVLNPANGYPIIPTTTNFMDYYMFSTVPTVSGIQSSYNGIYGNKISVNSSSIISRCNSVLFGTSFYSNTIGSDFNNNSIGTSFYSNTIGNGFYGNTIGSYSYYNTIGDGFRNNSISADFKNNSISADFTHNSISNSFNTNTIGTGFSNNSIGTGFSSNTIGNGFYSNTIGADFSSNSISNSFNTNTIDSSFSNNVAGDGFLRNTIGYGFKDNSIGNSFNDNSIGNSFSSSTIGDSFYNNTIDINFGSNVIGNSFNTNTIGTGFYNNTIGDSFNDNSIGNSFSSNSIGAGFNDNSIDNSFSNNTIGDSFFGNTIGTNFGYNVTSSGVLRNEIGNYFSRNTIGGGFMSNTIGNNFNKNTIDDNFSYTDYTSATYVYHTYTKDLFTNSVGNQFLKFYDESNVLQIVSITA